MLNERPYCDGCLQYYEGFCRCQTTVIAKVLAHGQHRVPMGRANQAEVTAMRRRLHAAALANTVDPIEILTVPGEAAGEVEFLVRRFR